MNTELYDYFQPKTLYVIRMNEDCTNVGIEEFSLDKFPDLNELFSFSGQNRQNINGPEEKKS